MTVLPPPFPCKDPKLLKLTNQLQSDYPDFVFNHGKKFAWRAPRTIIIGPPEPHSELLLLHELAHALLKHQNYHLDIDRLKMESAAWAKAKTLCQKYHIPWDEDVAEQELDTYRDWLHQKSRCPVCGLTRFQTTSGYHCPRCEEFIS
ncbi:hypothetical protein IKF57_01060 [Candidatus Saccharibacteria bacterium]|nr:hypothetical protein [Candidatus Saccharibacteria bacterium]